MKLRNDLMLVSRKIQKNLSSMPRLIDASLGRERTYEVFLKRTTDDKMGAPVAVMHSGMYVVSGLRASSVFAH